jgi:hypothetical protein
MTTETQQTTHGAILKGHGPGDFAPLDERPRIGGSLQARKLSTGEVRFYFRYSQLNEETQRSEKLRKAIGVWDPAAPPKMRTPSSRGFSVTAALERCAELGALQAERRNTGGLKEVALAHFIPRRSSSNLPAPGTGFESARGPCPVWRSTTSLQANQGQFIWFSGERPSRRMAKGRARQRDAAHRPSGPLTSAAGSYTRPLRSRTAGCLLAVARSADRRTPAA